MPIGKNQTHDRKMPVILSNQHLGDLVCPHCKKRVPKTHPNQETCGGDVCKELQYVKLQLRKSLFENAKLRRFLTVAVKALEGEGNAKEVAESLKGYCKK